MKKSLLTFLVMYLALSTAIAQDIIYTMSGEIDQNKTTLDSILIENITNGTQTLFSELPEHDYYQINLTKNAYWGTVGVNGVLENDIAFEMLVNSPGQIAISYMGEKPTEIKVSIYNINGQKVYASNKQSISIGNSVDIRLSNSGVYFVNVETPTTKQTFKAVGADGINQHSIKLSTRNGNEITLKSADFTKDDFSFVVGDSIVVTAYKDGYYAQPVRMKVAASEHINFLFEIARYQPNVITTTATEITSHSAKLNGEVSSDGNAEITQRGFYWSETNQTPDENDNVIIVTGTTGSFSEYISDLPEITRYYYRAFATNSEGTAVGNVENFTTLQVISTPTVQTAEATEITSYSAKLNGEVSSDGNAEITQRGFYWSFSNQNPDENDNVIIVTGTTGSFSEYISDLPELTRYYYRAFATNSEGTSLGDVKNVTTLQRLSVPSVQTDKATEITVNSAKLNGAVSSDGYAEITQRGFYWSLSNQYPDENDNVVVVTGTTGSFSKSISDLPANTTYYYRAFATNSEGTATGDVQNFKTPAIEIKLYFEIDTLYVGKEGGDFRVPVQTNTTFSIEPDGMYTGVFNEVELTKTIDGNEIILNVSSATDPFLTPKNITITSTDQTKSAVLCVAQEGDFSNESSNGYIKSILSKAASAFDLTYTIEAFYSNCYTTDYYQWSPFAMHDLNSSNSELYAAWASLYVFNRQLNTLQHVAGENSLKYISSLRAVLYYQLTVLWGDVPYIIDINDMDFFPSQTSISDIYSSLQDQLRNCIDEMPLEDIGSLFKVSKNVPKALLAKILMQQKQYSEALVLIKEIISSGMYQLNEDKNETLSSASSEIICGIDRYKFSTSNYDVMIESGRYLPLIQYSEVILLAAECEIKIGNPKAAINYLNQIRQRDGEAGTSAENFETDLKETWKNDMPGRFSYFDFLKRNDIAVTELNIVEYKELLPIPQRELELNSNLRQNPGY